MGDEAQDVVRCKTQRHRPEDTAHHGDIVEFADGAIDTEPVRDGARLQVDDLNAAPSHQGQYADNLEDNALKGRLTWLFN
jgi:hypothetical protein